jgi:hypothetical protein
MITGFTGTDLVYNIVEQQFVGEIDSVSINAQAVSGGWAGSTTAGAVNPFLANNPYLTSVKLKEGNADPAVPSFYGSTP